MLSIEMRTSFIWGLIHCFLVLAFFMGFKGNMNSVLERESFLWPKLGSYSLHLLSFNLGGLMAEIVANVSQYVRNLLVA